LRVIWTLANRPDLVQSNVARSCEEIYLDRRRRNAKHHNSKLADAIQLLAHCRMKAMLELSLEVGLGAISKHCV
jgi:hypothetical protein